ncbi:MAG: sulfurtransferase TusA family protein [Treponema sp.]|uniref:sulfurtransferase TusA family protein n=1 Tax=Treponema sp. TaxID=166 RepID=UPI003FA2A76F
MDTLKIDTKGLDCPIPLIELKKALKEAATGQLIELEFTCPEAVTTLPRHCQENNHEVVAFDRLDNKAWKIVVKK